MVLLGGFSVINSKLFKVAGHPVRSAARLCIIGDLSRGLVLTIKIYGRNCAPYLSRQRSGTVLKLLGQLLANVLFAGTYGYWQQMKTILKI